MILERHENRLDEGDKANAAIIKMINDHQKYDERMFERFSEKFEDIENRLRDLYKFRWMTAGVAAASVLVIGSASFFGNLLTTASQPPTMEFRSNPVQN